MGSEATPAKAASGPFVLDVHGELDRFSAPELCRQIDAAAADERNVVIDLSDVTCTDPSGVRLFAGAAREATVRLCTLVVTVPGRSALGRLLTITGLREFLPVEERLRNRPARRRRVSIGR